MDKGLYTGMLLIDLQKAFDTVNHSILYNKLKSVGIDHHAVKWFESYLSDRKQFVNVNGCCSSLGDMVCGVPQGSILGPLFNIYVNDMVRSVNCNLYMYADDAALVVSGLCIDNIENTLSSNIESLSIWLEENRLSLHLGKTESILFASQKKLKPKHIMNIKCKGKEIEGKKSVKYLGVTIDQDMSCKSTGNNFLSKINNRIKFLHRKASFFRFKERKIVSTALVQSHFDYACNF